MPQNASTSGKGLIVDSERLFILQQEGTLMPYPKFNAEQDAEVLHKAMKGLGKSTQNFIWKH